MSFLRHIPLTFHNVKLHYKNLKYSISAAQRTENYCLEAYILLIMKWHYRGEISYTWDVIVTCVTSEWYKRNLKPLSGARGNLDLLASGKFSEKVGQN